MSDANARVVIVAPRDPIPVNNGLSERIYQLAAHLGGRHTVSVVFPDQSLGDGRLPDERPFERVSLRSRTARGLDRVLPEYSPLRAPYGCHPWLYPALRRRFTRRPPDAVVVEFPYLVPVVRAATRGLTTPIVLSEHNVEYRFARRVGIPLWRGLAAFERAACRAVDGVVAVSETDRATLADMTDAPVVVAANGVDTTRYTPAAAARVPDLRARARESGREAADVTDGDERAGDGTQEPTGRRRDPTDGDGHRRPRAGGSADERRERRAVTDAGTDATGGPLLVYHGNLANAHNAEAVETLVSRVFPPLRRTLDATLLLVGPNPPKTDVPGVVTTGLVDDLPAYLAGADIAVAPIQSGSGTNLKILEYLASGVPVVTTPIGAEGLPLRDGREAVIVDDLDRMADAVEHLVADDATARRLSEAGRELAVAEFSWSVTLRTYDELLARLDVTGTPT